MPGPKPMWKREDPWSWSWKGYLASVYGEQRSAVSARSRETEGPAQYGVNLRVPLANPASHSKSEASSIVLGK